jgi:hypothetical protein
MRLSVLITIAFLSAGGCTAAGPLYEIEQSERISVPSTSGQVVFFRPGGIMLYSARQARIVIDGETVGGCGSGGYLMRDLVPGTYRLSSDMWDAPGRCEVVLNVEAGRVYYFRMDPRAASFLSFAGPLAAGELLASSFPVAVGAGVGGMAAESYGRACGGAFRLYPVEPSAALAELHGLRRSD